MSNEPDKIIYSMIGVSKYYDKKPVLKPTGKTEFVPVPAIDSLSVN